MRKIWRVGYLTIKYIIRWSVLLVLTFVAIVFLINVFTILSTQTRTLTLEELVESEYGAADVPVLVLGAGVVDNRFPSNILAERLNQAANIYTIAPDKAFIMSGDHREDNYNEVGVMKDYLSQQGIPTNQLYLDHAGYSTYASLYRLKYVIGEEQVIIVTQGYHLSRALMLARGLGLDAVGVPAPETTTSRFEREFREVFARVKDFAITYLGYEEEDVPETGYPFHLQMNGNETDSKGFLEENEN